MPKKGSKMNLAAVRSVELPEKPNLGAVATDARSVKCFQLFAQIAVRKRRFLSSLVVTGRFTARNVSEPDAIGSSKLKLPGSLTGVRGVFLILIFSSQVLP
jgi:hypothetical protein